MKNIVIFFRYDNLINEWVSSLVDKSRVGSSSERGDGSDSTLTTKYHAMVYKWLAQPT